MKSGEVEPLLQFRTGLRPRTVRDGAVKLPRAGDTLDFYASCGAAEVSSLQRGFGACAPCRSLGEREVFAKFVFQCRR